MTTEFDCARYWHLMDDLYATNRAYGSALRSYYHTTVGHPDGVRDEIGYIDGEKESLESALTHIRREIDALGEPPTWCRYSWLDGEREE